MAGNHNSGRRPYSAQQLALHGQQIPRGRVEGAGPQDEKITSFDQCMTIEGYRSLTARQKRIYKDVCSRFIAMKILEPLYLMSLYLLAINFDHAIDLEKDVQKNGMYTVRYDATGQVVGTVINPAYKLLLNTQAEIRMISSNFGLSPAERRKIMDAANPQNVTINIFDQLKKEAHGNDIDEQDD